MARQPELFVYELDSEQVQRLVKITRTTRDRVRLRRTGVVQASVQGRSAGEIAMMFAASENYVREVIHAFNTQGFAALDPKWNGGRPRKFGPAARELICRIARSAPTGLGQPFTTWSLTKLVADLRGHYRLTVSTETVRRVLRHAGITWQRTTTWKTSRDPDFAALAQPSLSPEAALRRQLQDPQAGLPTQRCVMQDQQVTSPTLRTCCRWRE